MISSYDQELNRATNKYLAKQTDYDNYIDDVMIHIESDNEELDNWLNSEKEVDVILDRCYRQWIDIGFNEQIFKLIAREITALWEVYLIAKSQTQVNSNSQNTKDQ